MGSPADFPASLEPLVPSGAKARIRANIAALQLLRTVQDAGRPATAAEQRVLAAWSGWGAVPQVFDPRDNELADERDTLAELTDIGDMLSRRRAAASPSQPGSLEIISNSSRGRPKPPRVRKEKRRAAQTSGLERRIT